MWDTGCQGSGSLTAGRLRPREGSAVTLPFFPGGVGRPCEPGADPVSLRLLFGRGRRKAQVGVCRSWNPETKTPGCAEALWGAFLWVSVHPGGWKF